MSDSWLEAKLRPLRLRIQMAIGRAVLRAIDDSAGRQRVQVELMKGELRDGVERMQDYGFTSHPHPGADAAAIFIGGNRAKGIVICVDDRRYRLTGLEQGEVAMFDDQGNQIVLRRDKIEVTAVALVEVTAPEATVTAPIIGLTGAVTITGSLDVQGPISGTGDVEITGNLTASGTVTGTTDVVAGTKDLKTHHHIEHDGFLTGGPQ